MPKLEEFKAGSKFRIYVPKPLPDWVPKRLLAGETWVTLAQKMHGQIITLKSAPHPWNQADNNLDVIGSKLFATIDQPFFGIPIEWLISTQVDLGKFKVGSQFRVKVPNPLPEQIRNNQTCYAGWIANAHESDGQVVEIICEPYLFIDDDLTPILSVVFVAISDLKYIESTKPYWDNNNKPSCGIPIEWLEDYFALNEEIQIKTPLGNDAIDPTIYKVIGFDPERKLTKLEYSPSCDWNGIPAPTISKRVIWISNNRLIKKQTSPQLNPGGEVILKLQDMQANPGIGGLVNPTLHQRWEEKMKAVYSENIEEVDFGRFQIGTKCRVNLPKEMPSWVGSDWYDSVKRQEETIVTLERMPFKFDFDPPPVATIASSNFFAHVKENDTFIFCLDWLTPIIDPQGKPILTHQFKIGDRCLASIPKKPPFWLKPSSDSLIWFDNCQKFNNKIVHISTKLTPGVNHPNKTFLGTLENEWLSPEWLVPIVGRDLPSRVVLNPDLSPRVILTKDETMDKTDAQKILEKVEATHSETFQVLQKELEVVRKERDKFKLEAQDSAALTADYKQGEAETLEMYHTSLSTIDEISKKNTNLFQKVTDLEGQLTLTQGHLALVEKKAIKNKVRPGFRDFVATFFAWGKMSFEFIGAILYTIAFLVVFRETTHRGLSLAKKGGSLAGGYLRLAIQPITKIKKVFQSQWRKTDLGVLLPLALLTAGLTLNVFITLMWSPDQIKAIDKSEANQKYLREMIQLIQKRDQMTQELPPVNSDDSNKKYY